MLGGLLIGVCAAWSAHADELPDLTGHWVAQYEVQSTQGIASASSELFITEQNGYFIRGNATWRYDPATDVIGDDGTEVGQEGKEDFMGMIDWDGRTVIFTDNGDNGHWWGELVDANTLHVTYVESGEFATVLRAAYIRQPAQD
jgi:hypothetical protein